MFTVVTMVFNQSQTSDHSNSSVAQHVPLSIFLVQMFAHAGVSLLVALIIPHISTCEVFQLLKQSL
jgi:hypothetical protein